MKKNLLIKIISIYLILASGTIASQTNYFKEGVKLFEEKKFDESRIFFERDIVFNPKKEISYLYLAKIYNENNNDEEFEMKLKSVLLLNSQNDEALYMLTLLKIRQSDYNQARKLIDKFILVCKTFCAKKEEMQEKFSKLIPENEKVEN